MKRVIIYAVMSLFITAPFVSASQQFDYKKMTAELKKIDRQNPGLVELQSIGKTVQGRDIWLVSLTNEKTGSSDKKTAIFISSNIEADYIIGSRAVILMIKHFVSAYETNPAIKKMLDEKALYFVPRVNPDGADYVVSHPVQTFISNLNSFDDDHDALVDEDGPEDINKDGFITMMRVKDPLGKFQIDPADDRLLIKADPTKAQTGIYTVYTEGLDNDKDGVYNEDGPGGPEINRNFPHAYPYDQNGSGTHIASEAETKALIDFLVNHRNIAAILTYSPEDNLLVLPKPARKKPSQDPATPPERRFFMSRTAPKGINPRDLPYFKEISKKYKQLTGFSGKTLYKRISPAGSFAQYGYYQYGVPSLTTPFWYLTQIEEKKEKPTQGKKKPASPNKQSNDLKTLKVIDSQNIGNGFIPWKKFQHPDLGEVEIGGFNPQIHFNLSKIADSLIIKQSNFVIELAGLLPKLEIVRLETKILSNNVYLIEAEISNSGFLPTALKHGQISITVQPPRATLEGKGFSLLAGKHHVFLKPLNGSGAAEKITWLVKAKPGTRIKLHISSNKSGSIIRTIKLR